MAIARKPNRSLSDIAAKASVEDAARAFIEGAAPAPTPPAGRKRKEPVLLRFDDDMLAAIDREAAKLGLSRAGWVRMTVARTLGDRKDI